MIPLEPINMFLFKHRAGPNLAIPLSPRSNMPPEENKWKKEKKKKKRSSVRFPLNQRGNMNTTHFLSKWKYMVSFWDPFAQQLLKNKVCGPLILKTWPAQNHERNHPFVQAQLSTGELPIPFIHRSFQKSFNRVFPGGPKKVFKK